MPKPALDIQIVGESQGEGFEDGEEIHENELVRGWGYDESIYDDVSRMLQEDFKKYKEDRL